MKADRVVPVLVALAVSLAGASAASAQPLGTFRWQQQPYCNVITVNVVQSGAIYHLNGTDDQCGAATSASVVGMAFLNANGTVGMGLTLVTTPGGTPLHIDATIALTLNGTWRDSAGATGAFVFTPGAGTGGSSRPVPRASFPAGLSAGGTTITNVGAPVSGSDAATKSYVDSTVAAKANAADVRTALLAKKSWAGVVSSAGTKSSTGRYTTTRSGLGSFTMEFDVMGLGIAAGTHPVWSATPHCSGFTAAIVFRFLSIGVGSVVNAFSVRVETRDTAAALADCTVSITAVFPDADVPNSPVPPFIVGGASADSCTTVDDATTCVEGIKPQ